MTNEYAMKVLTELRGCLDKIIAEIWEEAEWAYSDFDDYKEAVLEAEPDELPDDEFRFGLHRAVEIINKYKAHVTDINVGKMAESEVAERMTRGFCVYHGIECDYKGSCIDCPHNTVEDTEWFRRDEERAESEE